MSNSTLPFDRVRLSGRVISAEQFLALPLPQRVKLMFNRQVAFYLGEEEIPRRVALRQLRILRSVPGSRSPPAGTPTVDVDRSAR